MPKLLLIYYSRTGNTEKMVEAIFEGAKNGKDIDVDLKLDHEVTPEETAGSRRNSYWFTNTKP